MVSKLDGTDSSLVTPGSASIMLACSWPFAFKAARVCSAFFGTPVLVHVSVSASRNLLSLMPVSGWEKKKREEEESP